MVYLLDTNVISELVKPAPDPNVVGWTQGQTPLDLALSVLTLGEIEKGIALMPLGARRTRLAQWAGTQLLQHFAGRLLAVDDSVALAWGQLAAAAQSAARPLPVVDGLLLATAKTHGLTFVTRNIGDCANRGVPVFDPWTGITHA